MEKKKNEIKMEKINVKRNNYNWEIISIKIKKVVGKIMEKKIMGNGIK